MKETDLVLTRRDFMRAAACQALMLALGPKIRTGAKSRVVLVRDSRAIDENGNIDSRIIQEMMDQGVCALLDASDPAAGWRTLVRASDLVGIKSNVWSPLPTPFEVEEAIRRGLSDAGIPKKRILIDDRGALRSLAGCTALVNARPLRTHHWSGIGGCIKNYIMFIPNPPEAHPDACADLGAIWNLPILKGKTKLNVLVMLTPLFYGRGPHHFDSRYVWDYKGIILSRDPVAADAVGVHILQNKRRIHFGRDLPFSPVATHVQIADVKHRVGVSDLSKIEIVKVGWTKDILI